MSVVFSVFAEDPPNLPMGSDSKVTALLKCLMMNLTVFSSEAREVADGDHDEGADQ